MILDSASVDANLRLHADACVVGSGAGGAAVARELAAGGVRVVVLEEGSYWRTSDLTQREEEMYPRLYREHGTHATADYTVLVSQGRALGGSTVVGYCLCFHPPAGVLAEWRRHHGLGVSRHEMGELVREVEERLGVRTVGRGELNANNRILASGAERLGLRGRLARHNRLDCPGCGYCALGCAYDRKRDALLVDVTEASRLGALVVPDCRVDKIEAGDGRVEGVRGTLLKSRDGRRHEVVVRAPIVVLAAGALGSPRLWRRSRLPDPAGEVGRHLHLQPQVAVAAVFDGEVRAWEGVPQTYVVDEFLDLDRRADGGFLFLAAAAPPVAFAAMLPGMGARHRALALAYRRIAALRIVLHDRTSGRVEVDREGRVIVSYHLDQEDQEELIEAMRRAADLYFAAGARSVLLPYNELVVLRRRGAYRALEERGLRPNDPLLVSFHPHGTLRLGANRHRSVVDPHGEAHGVKGLFVADASVLPGPLGVPPQITIMALALRTARHILARRRRYLRVRAENPRSP